MKFHCRISSLDFDVLAKDGVKSNSKNLRVVLEMNAVSVAEQKF